MRERELDGLGMAHLKGEMRGEIMFATLGLTSQQQERFVEESTKTIPISREEGLDALKAFQAYFKEDRELMAKTAFRRQVAAAGQLQEIVERLPPETKSVELNDVFLINLAAVSEKRITDRITRENPGKSEAAEKATERIRGGIHDLNNFLLKNPLEVTASTLNMPEFYS